MYVGVKEEDVPITHCAKTSQLLAHRYGRPMFKVYVATDNGVFPDLWGKK